MGKTRDEYLRQISNAGVIAVIRAPSKDILVDIAKALIAGGIPSIEVTMSTPNAIAGIEMLASKFGDSCIMGVGTVLDGNTAKDAIAAGSQFVVSPMFDEGIVAATKEAGKIAIPGAFTVTEIMRAWREGADVVKVFPSTSLGPNYFKDVLAPLPQLKLTPTGGVDLKNAGEWIKAGAVFVGAGSALVSKEAMATKNWAAIESNARAFVDVIKKARNL
jgi:2-dehydro-3-deoxyphosphogluconate aldolase / (4S)-4-hydroxy-2-oxoglutarate aldolase